MKNNKLFILALSAPLLLTGITSCGAKHTMKHGEFIKNPQGLRYLYEVTYEDYDWADVTNWMNSKKNVNANQGSFGCSSIHFKNFYGRSFDFCYTDMCEFLVRTPHNGDRYASIGVSIADCNVNDAKVNAIITGEGATETDRLNEKMIPFTMVDGINENGVVCNTNVVPAKDLLPHEGEEKYFTHSTNPGKEKLFYQFMPRFILDNAKSAKHAIELLKNRNLTAINSRGEQCDYLGVSKMGYELHCMIADKDDTFIVEMVDDEMNVIKSCSYIMTNYYLTNSTPSGAGLERYSILFEDWKKWDKNPELCTIDAMKETIQKVQYSPCYKTTDSEGTELDCPVWPTEFAGCEIPEVPGEHITFYNAESYCRKNWLDMKDGLANAYSKTQEEEISEKGRATATGPSVPWISTHAEAYDIENRTLHLVTQEDDANQTKLGKYNFKEFKL